MIKADTDTKKTDTEETKEKNRISDKTVIRLLIAIIIILLIYILGMQAVDILNNIPYETQVTAEETIIENTTEAVNNKVNINSDNIFELTSLKGIGKAKAEAIIEYRKENGDFISIDELKEVPGIGDSLFEQIKNSITVE